MFGFGGGRTIAAINGIHGFAPALTSFLGRADDVGHVAELLGEYPMVTVTGPGGVGKTRLAGEVARQVAGRFADGVWLVELAAVRDAALVPAAVAAALGLPQAPDRPVAETLAEVMSRRQALIVIDNCEHVLDAVAGLCATLLSTADDVRVLATSRVQPLLDRLEDNFQILTSGDRAAPARHHSLAATVEWSYGLLDETKRRVFRRLSVFPGSFTLDAATAVAGDATEPAVLRLVDCSLIAPPQPGPDGRARYLMLETIRVFAAERLGREGERDASAAALARYMLRIADQAAAGLKTGAGEQAAAQLLDAENATLHLVLAWSLDHDQATALPLAVALSPWWHLRGRSAEAYAVLGEAVGRNPAEPGPLDDWAAAQFWLGQSAAYTGANATALEHFTAASTALAAVPPSPVLADVLANRAFTLLNLDRAGEAGQDARQGLTVARDLAYAAGEAAAWQCLATPPSWSTNTATGLSWPGRPAGSIPRPFPGSWPARTPSSSRRC